MDEQAQSVEVPVVIKSMEKDVLVSDIPEPVIKAQEEGDMLVMVGAEIVQSPNELMKEPRKGSGLVSIPTIPEDELHDLLLPSVEMQTGVSENQVKTEWSGGVKVLTMRKTQDGEEKEKKEVGDVGEKNEEGGALEGKEEKKGEEADKKGKKDKGKVDGEGKEHKEKAKKEKKEKKSKKSNVERIQKKLEKMHAKIERILAKKEVYLQQLAEAQEKERQEKELQEKEQNNERLEKERVVSEQAPSQASHLDTATKSSAEQPGNVEGSASETQFSQSAEVKQVNDPYC